MLIDICKTYFDDRFDVSLLYTRKLNKKLKSYLNWDWILTSADWLNLQNLGIWKGKKKKKSYFNSLCGIKLLPRLSYPVI